MNNVIFRFNLPRVYHTLPVTGVQNVFTGLVSRLGKVQKMAPRPLGILKNVGLRTSEPGREAFVAVCRNQSSERACQPFDFTALGSQAQSGNHGPKSSQLGGTNYFGALWTPGSGKEVFGAPRTQLRGNFGTWGSARGIF